VEESIWDETGVEHKETVKGRKEITTHVSIHTIHLDGLRELYRHFLRLPDGAVVEVSSVRVIQHPCMLKIKTR
jgi:hypothetical protein